MPQHYLPGCVHQLQLKLIFAHHQHLVLGCKGGTRSGGLPGTPKSSPGGSVRPTSTSFQEHLSPQQKVLGHNPPPTKVGARLSSSPGASQGYQDEGPRAGSPPPTFPRGTYCSLPWARSTRMFPPGIGGHGGFTWVGGNNKAGWSRHHPGAGRRDGNSFPGGATGDTAPEGPQEVPERLPRLNTTPSPARGGDPPC